MVSPSDEPALHDAPIEEIEFDDAETKELDKLAERTCKSGIAATSPEARPASGPARRDRTRRVRQPACGESRIAAQDGAPGFGGTFAILKPESADWIS